MRSAIEAIFDAGMHPGNVVFDVIESDLARDPDHSRHIRDYLRSRGFGLALSGAGVGAGDYSFQAGSDFAPSIANRTFSNRITSYLDSRLVQNIGAAGMCPHDQHAGPNG